MSKEQLLRQAHIFLRQLRLAKEDLSHTPPNLRHWNMVLDLLTALESACRHQDPNSLGTVIYNFVKPLELIQGAPTHKNLDLIEIVISNLATLERPQPAIKPIIKKRHKAA
jgi:hypothetical protein